MIKKYCRILYDGKPSWGQLDGDKISIIDGDLLGNHTVTAKTIASSGVRLLAPVTPTKIVCVGLNYADHVKESQSANSIPEEPVTFMKPLTARIGPEDTIRMPLASKRVD